MAGAGGGAEAVQRRTNIMKMLERREQDAEELDLESSLSEMRAKVAGDPAAVDLEIESLASETRRPQDPDAKDHQF